MYHSILVAMALDHDLSDRLLTLAQKILEPGGKITALHVLEEPAGTANARLREDLEKEGVARARDLFEKKLAKFPEVTPKLVQGHVSRTIMEMAGQVGADCIVMGSHRPDLADFLIGSNAARVVRHATCSVHVFRGS